MLLSVMLFIFTDYVPDPVIKFKAGWAFIGVFSFKLFVNLIYLVFSFGSTIFTFFRRTIIRIKKLKNLKMKNRRSTLKIQPQEGFFVS